MSRSVLLTGFGPFGPHKVNPSELLVKSLEGWVVGGRVVAARVLPVETRALRERLGAAVDAEQPEIVIGVGLAAGISALALERVGVNLLDFTLPDAVGVLRRDEPIERGGPEARLTTLPVREIVDAWHAGGIPGYVSTSAGTYLCNQWLYETLGLVARRTPPIPAGFIHVPALPAQAIEAGAERTPSMSLELMRKGLESAIETVASWLDARPEPAPARSGGAQVWIPRGLREVER